MRESRNARPDTATDHRASERQEEKLNSNDLSRRTFLGVGSAGIATVALASMTAKSQEKPDMEKTDRGHFASNPGPENDPLLNENPNSNLPPPTDYGNIESLYGTPSI